MKSFLLIGLGIYFSWEFTDFNSQDVLTGVLAPISLILFSAALMGWLVMKIKFLRSGDYDGVGYFDDFDSGGE